MAEEANPNLPKPPEDPARLRELREIAVRRLDGEMGGAPLPAPVYGSPPLPRRSWTLRGLLILLGIVLAGLLAWMFGRRPPIPVAVYGGPPAPQPPPPEPAPEQHNPAPVYGAPPPRPPEPPR